MKFFQTIFLVCVFSYFFTCDLNATVYNLTGSNQTRYVTGSPANIVQTNAKGFVFFTNGIVFDGTVNVALPVPACGRIQFGNGTTCRLVLESDLTFGSTAGTATNTVAINTTNGVAEIDGQGATITFDSDTFFPNSRAFRIMSNTTIDGGGHDMVFGRTLTFSVDTGANLTIRDAHVRNLQDLNFVGAGTLVFYNVVVSLDNNFTYSGNASIGTPKLMFDDYTKFDGKNKKFIFAGGRDMVFISDATVTFEPTVTFSWASQRRNGLVMDDVENNLFGAGSFLYFNNSNFYLPSHGPFKGLNLKKGNLVFENNCNIYNESNLDITRSLQLGDASSSANNTDVYVLSGAQINVDGYVYDASV